ncbi:hypothetical protein [Streptomyces sp. TRM64462]|uniref:hypothetical protein n=1 Tax=Streptomyces sp. TRM64462 TaxID=2741726 RepID=UPI0015863EA8|nr:hypothetical protein [Streptomyces sp. TRM64462]
MYARLTTYEGTPVPADRNVAATNQAALDQARQIPGFQGVYYLIDRERGKALTLTLWEDEEAMRASEERADAIRRESAERDAMTVVSVERYEVGMAHLES